ncbi:protein bag-of-marbles [Drosophila tropicalis]|uniref:protein bag-of-marbles n=1 Tax=Drosophila tropicalis TaxID=46794 RepID=UPI0035ABD412
MAFVDEDLQLDNNLNELYSEIDNMLNCGDNEVEVAFDAAVLMDLEKNVNALRLDAKANAVRRYPSAVKALAGTSRKKSRSHNGGGDGKSLVSRQKQQQLREENMWNQSRTLEQLIGINGDCQERNDVFRLLDLFHSLHDIINNNLACTTEHFLPSDYLFDMPKKCTMPKTLNLRHQILILYTKLERFLNSQRCILEANRHFDYNKYTECDNMLNKAMSCLKPIKRFSSIEIRHRSWQFSHPTTKANAQQLERLLYNMRECLKTAHLWIHAFNWEMDLQYRYSKAMTESLQANNERALLVAAAEAQAAVKRPLTSEELFISEKYQLQNVIECAAEHDEFLNALIYTPELYFPPETLTICEPSANRTAQSAIAEPLEAAYNEWIAYEEILFEAPSSPPKLNLRPHQPWKYRG